MTDGADATATDSERMDELVAKAEALVDTEGLWRGRILYTGVDLGMFDVLDALDPYDFSRFSHVCDVGGGRGHLLCHVLEAIPHLRGTVLDLPGVVTEEERRWASKLDVTDRCTYVGGDMFERVPEADAYFLKWILHNWDDEECRQILSTVHEAAPADGRLFVIESVVPGPGTPHFAKRLDVTMMAQVGGRERTEAEYAALLERADWELVERWTPEEGPLSILEAEKVERR